MTRLQDFRLELWGFDALLEDGTYAFLVFADATILATRHGLVIGRIFPAGGQPWGLVRRVSPRHVVCAPDEPRVSFGTSHFRRDAARITAFADAGTEVSFDYAGPFDAHEPAEPLWQEGDRRIAWQAPSLGGPVHAHIARGTTRISGKGTGIHAYLFAKFNPFRPPVKAVSVGHLNAAGRTAFFLDAVLRGGAGRVQAALSQDGSVVSCDTAGSSALADNLPQLDCPALPLRGTSGERILAGPPVQLIDGLPGWIVALAAQITPGVDLIGWVGRGELDDGAGDLIYAGVRWA